jgi:DNA-binding response OmpR family regulator
MVKKNTPERERTINMVNSNREKKRILFVEDHEDSWEIVALHLAECVVVYARDFNEGLRLARRGYYDLYILDNWLPEGSGIRLCRLIREFDPHTPILFYSACAYPRDKQAAFSAGAQAYLTKPVGFDELTQAVALLASVPHETAFEARQAEIAAILEDLAIRQAANVERVGSAKEKYLRAEEKALRAKAQRAFLAAGGTRGDFAREWPSVFMEEVRCARTSAARSG